MSALLILSAAISMFVDVLKRLLVGSTLPKDVLSALYVIASAIFGIAGVALFPAILNDPLLDGTPFEVASWQSYIAVGLAASLGSKGIYFLLELTNSSRDALKNLTSPSTPTPLDPEELYRRVADLLIEDVNAPHDHSHDEE